MSVLSPADDDYRMAKAIPASAIIERMLGPGTFAPGKCIALIRGPGVRKDLADAYAASVFSPEAHVQQFDHEDPRVGGYQANGENFNPLGSEFSLYPCDDEPNDDSFPCFLPAPNLIGGFHMAVTLHYRKRDQACLPIVRGYKGAPPNGHEWDEDACM